MNTRFLIIAPLLTFVLTACGDDGMTTPDATPDAPMMGDATPGDADPADANPADADPADADPADADPADAMPDAMDAGGEGATCGTLGAAPCGADFYCNFAMDDCGATDRPGVCERRPETCDGSYEPVCGCDGAIHSNVCTAAGAGSDVNLGGGCAPPERTFSCGYGFCTLTPPELEYCERQVSDIGGMPDMYTCHEAPVTCSRLPLCMCLERATVPCSDMCIVTRGGGQLVTCPGG